MVYLAMRLIDLTGQKFGRLIVIGRSKESDGKHTRWDCDCECGAVGVTATSDDLKSGRKRSCKCLQKELASAKFMKHGHKRIGMGTREYESWCSAKARCFNSAHPGYALYGGRGITVCPEWVHDFGAFLTHIGPRPPRTSLDRYPDQNGNYEPGNVRWASATEQGRNKRNNVCVKWHGQLIPLVQIAEIENVNYKSLHWLHRKNGLPIEEAVARLRR